MVKPAGSRTEGLGVEHLPASSGLMTELDSRRKGYVAEEELPRGIQRCLRPLSAQEVRPGDGGQDGHAGHDYSPRLHQKEG